MRMILHSSIGAVAVLAGAVHAASFSYTEQIPVETFAAMREVDRIAIEEIGIPSMVLMENAAIGLVDAIGESYSEAVSAAIFCGPGNNGGDGLALARHLTSRGYQVEVSVVTSGRELGGDARIQLDICRNQGLSIRELGPGDSLQRAIENAARCDLVVDALFGTGLTRPLTGHFGPCRTRSGSPHRLRR